MNNIKVNGERLTMNVERLGVKALVSILIIILFLFSACNPEAKWETENVKIQMKVGRVSAGFVQCSFSTTKDAYYLIAIEPVRIGYDPMAHQKQFMMLALDSANVKYLAWRNSLLRQGEFNIAPFASHALQYGQVEHSFTGLLPGRDYWIYSFVVNPETQQPAGPLYLDYVTTADSSICDVHFAYRVNGRWDYTYPLDTTDHIDAFFPYIATTFDSMNIATSDKEAFTTCLLWVYDKFDHPDSANVIYGVRAVENDGWRSNEYFEEGHTYYTCVSGFDGLFDQLTIYKFKWTGDSCKFFYHDTDSANIMNWILDVK